MSYADELSVKLTAKDEMSARLRGVKKELEATSRAMVKARKEFETTGSPEAVAELKRLEAEHKRLAKAYKESSDAAKKARDEYKGFTEGAGKASTALGRLGQSIEKHQKRIQQAGVVGAAAMLLFAKSSISAFAEAEKSQVQLEQAYAKFPKMANASIESMRGLNNELMNLTGADDDALAGAEALLARFDLTGQQIQQLIPLVNDYSIATGQDLSSSADVIGKSLLGNAKALKSLGINFKATGDRGKDLASIMAALQEKVGGAGAAFGQTTAGQLEIANQSFENMKEEIGAALVPALQAFVSILKPVTGFIAGLPKPLKLVIFSVAALAMGLMILTPRILTVRAALVRMGAAAGQSATKVGLIGRMRGVFGKVAGAGGIASAAIIGVGIALEAYASAQANAQQAAQDYADTLDAITGKVTAASYEKVAAAISGDLNTSDQELLAQYGFSLADMTAAAVEGGPKLEAMKKAMDSLSLATKAAAGTAGQMTPEQQRLINALGGASSSLDNQREVIGDGAEAWRVHKAAVDAAASATRKAASAEDAATAAAERQTAAEKRLAGALTWAEKLLARHDAMRAYRKAMKDYIAKPSAEAGDAVSSAMMGVANTYTDPVKRAKYLKTAYEDFATKVKGSGLPSSIKRSITQPLHNAYIEAQKLLNTVGAINAVPWSAANPNGSGGYRPMVKRALGGMVYGPGTGTSDSIPAMLSAGEFVVRSAAVSAIGPDVLHRINQADRMPVPSMPILGPAPVPVVTGSGGDHFEVTQNITAAGQIDFELGMQREFRRMERDRRTRMAGTR